MSRTNYTLTTDANGTLSIVDIPIPSIGPDEVLVDVEVAAVNEMDVEIVAGKWRSQVAGYRKRGHTLTGFEFSGVARTQGKRIQQGQRVIGYVHVTKGPRTHARTIAVEESVLHPIPETISMQDAASIVSMGLSAVEILERLRPVQKDEEVLVIGASGGLGSYCVQLAKFKGAHVTGVCSKRNVNWVREIGADEVRAYEDEEPLREGDEFDLVVDTPPTLSFSKCHSYLARSGMYVTTNPFKDLWGFLRAIASRRKSGFMLVLETDTRKLGRLLEVVQEGAIRPAIDSVFPVQEAEAAFGRFSGGGKQGRVLLDFNPTSEGRTS